MGTRLMTQKMIGDGDSSLQGDGDSSDGDASLHVLQDELHLVDDVDDVDSDLGFELLAMQNVGFESSGFEVVNDDFFVFDDDQEA